jgi:hypothetical protein
MIRVRKLRRMLLMEKPVIVQGEDPAAYTALLESLTAEYQPETQMQQIIVMEAARAAWELARANREFDKSQHKLYGQQENMGEWNAAQQAEFERMLRYRTRAERAYNRGLQAVEHLRKLHLQAEQRAFWENLQAERLALSKQRLKLATERMRKASEPKSAPKEKDEPAPVDRFPRALVHLYQIIEIRILDGNLSIRSHPATQDLFVNADLSQEGAQVRRCFEFPDGIPAEYAWINGPDIQRNGIVWKQTFENVYLWRTHVEREDATAPGHFLPRVYDQPGNDSAR